MEDGSDIDRQWRSTLRAYLADHIDEPLLLGNVIDRFAPVMPLHHATRHWSSQRKGMQGSMAEMRDACMRAELRAYPLSWEIERLNGKPIPRNTIFRPLTRSCPGCGKSFFARRWQRYCSSPCGTMDSKRRARQAMRSAARTPQMQRLVGRIERAIDELEHLKDALLESISRGQCKS